VKFEFENLVKTNNSKFQNNKRPIQLVWKKLENHSCMQNKL